jgi:tetratricopeptide (TPR) repeat protein
VLEKALLDEPDNARYEFYLAQSYRDAGDPELAIRHYRRRVEMGGWAEEVFYALYQIARLKEQLGRPWEEVLQDHLAAYQFQAERVEPLYQIGMHYQHRREFHLAHLFLGRAVQLSFPQGNRLFVEKHLYDYLAALEYAVSCYWVGYHAEAIAVNDRLLAGGLLPKHHGDRVAQNRKYSVDAVGST